MENRSVFDYLFWRSDLDFSQDKFNEVDALILNIVSFIDYKEKTIFYPSANKIKLTELIDNFFKENEGKKISLGLIIPNEMIDVVKCVAKSKRYQNIMVSNYVNSVDRVNTKQFSAMTFHLDENNIFVSYKGTDDTLVGWAEDFSMLAEFPIPAQRDSCQYLNDIATIFSDKDIYVGGHSKGGNLAIYSSLYSNEKIHNRIKKVYSLDGPGFLKDTLDRNIFDEMKSKIFHIIPSGGIVGRLFNLPIDPIIVKSYEKGLNQHNPLSWIVNSSQFEKVDSFSKYSDNIKHDVDDLISSMPLEDRVDFATDLQIYLDNLKQDNLIEFLDFKNVISLLFNKHRIKHKNMRYLIKLYKILRKNKAILIKIQK